MIYTALICIANGVKDVPYIANWIYEHPGLDLALKGIWIADPSLTYGAVQQEIPALRFAQVAIVDWVERGGVI